MDILNIMGFACHEIRIGRFSAVLFVLLVAFFLFPQESSCEFYKYVDKDGKIHYVDSKAKIPGEYRKDLTFYEEKYDHLSEKERQERIAISSVYLNRSVFVVHNTCKAACIDETGKVVSED